MSGGTIAVDFDGVIHAYRKGWQGGQIYDEPMPGTQESLNWLMDRYAVFVHTTRKPEPVCDWIEDKLGISTCWFGSALRHDRNNPSYQWESWAEPEPEFWNERGTLLVTQHKLPAIAYIDDRGIHFTTWEAALAELVARYGNVEQG